MYISRATLQHGPALFNLIRHRTGTDGYAVHKLLWNLFPNDGTKKRDFLFCRDERAAMPRFYIVSKDVPVESEGVRVETKPYQPQLVEGQQLYFSLTANPVISRKTEGKERSVKHDVWMDAKKRAQMDNAPDNAIPGVCESAVKRWLVRQGEKYGFVTDDKTIVVDGYTQNRCYKKGKKKAIRYSSIHCEGVLTVKSPGDFTDMLYCGLGSSKAFGCGLMLVRPVS